MPTLHNSNISQSTQLLHKETLAIKSNYSNTYQAKTIQQFFLHTNIKYVIQKTDS